MIVSRETIAKLNPCTSRFDNYTGHYGDRGFTPRQFMGLRHITHQDKLWVAFRMLSHEKAAMAAADIAESVLTIFEKTYPNDKRPRECIDAVRLFVKGEITKGQLYEKRGFVYEATNAATYADAILAADAVTHVAACAANRAAPIALLAVGAATDAVHETARGAQEKFCRTIILRYWRDDL